MGLHRAVYFESADGRIARLLRSGWPQHAPSILARAARFHAHQLQFQSAAPSPDSQYDSRAQWRRLCSSDRNGHQGCGRRSGRIRGNQGRIWTALSSWSMAAASPPSTATCRGSPEELRTGQRVKQGATIGYVGVPAPQQGRICTTSIASTARTRIRGPCRCPTPHRFRPPIWPTFRRTQAPLLARLDRVRALRFRSTACGLMTPAIV